MSHYPSHINEPADRLHIEVTDKVGWLVLDNPKKHNAMSLQMWRLLVDSLAKMESDPAVRCVVIRGQGDRAFCTGSDIDEKNGISEEQAKEHAQVVLRGQRAVSIFQKPTIAMVSGHCLGGGLGLAIGCDIRLAGSNASFGIPAAKIGLSYYYNELRRLTDLVGPARAKQLFFTADRIPADRALQIGLVEEVVPTDELPEFTARMAGRIAGNAPLSIAAAKFSIETATSVRQDLDIESCDARARACLSSEDYIEGRRAFKEKRAPMFHGR